jgi:hypothetical protein
MALQGALVTLVEDAALRARMGAVGRAQAYERFSLPVIAGEFGRILFGAPPDLGSISVGEADPREPEPSSPRPQGSTSA